MAETLSQIFGEGALVVKTVDNGSGVNGVFNIADATPLTGIYLSYGNPSLVVSKDNCVGHYPPFPTLPAYKMLGLIGLIKNKSVARVSNAQFTRIVTVKDLVLASQTTGTSFKVERLIEPIDTVKPQDVASMDLEFSDKGTSLHTVGILLEIASQTIVANMAKHLSGTETLYPLILSIEEIAILNSNISSAITAVPAVISEIDKKNRFSGSMVLQNQSGQTVANVTNVNFMFATGKQIAGFYRWNAQPEPRVK